MKKKMIAVVTAVMMLFSMLNATSLVFADVEGNDPDPPEPCDYYTKFEPGDEQTKDGITVIFGDKEGNEYKTVSWTAIDDIQVLYVFVKAGSAQSNEDGESGDWYDYTKEDGDTGLTAPEGRDISHVSFYYVDAAKLKIQKVLQGEQIADDEQEFNIIIKKGNVIFDSFTLSNGEEEVFKLPLGTYKVEEEQSLDLYSLVGYTLDETNCDGTIVLNQKSQVKTLVVTNEKADVEENELTKLTVRKVLVDNDGETEITGDSKKFTIKIWPRDEKVKICELAGGEEQSFDLEPGGYLIEEDEVAAPYSFEGFFIGDMKLEEGVFVLGENDTTITVVNKKDIDQQPTTGTITINKKIVNSHDTTSVVTGDDTLFNGKLVYVPVVPTLMAAMEYDFDVNPSKAAVIPKLPFGKYEVIEYAKDGYEPLSGEQLYVTISEEDPDDVALLVNKKVKANVVIDKILLDKDGNAIDERTKTYEISLTGPDKAGNTYTVPVNIDYTTGLLPLGIYTVAEVNPPSGYDVEISHPTFTLTSEGFKVTVTNQEKSNDPPTPDPKGTIIIKKVILDKNEHINTTETREFVIRVKKNSETDNYVDFTLKNGELEKRGQFDLGEYVISELDLPADYDVFFSLSSDTDEDGKVDLNKDGDTVTVTVTNMQKDTPSIPTIPTISKDDGGVRVYPGDTITYEIEVDPKDYSINRAYILETPDLNTEYIGGNEWQLYNTDESGRKTYRYNLVSEIPHLMALDFEDVPEIPDFKVRVKATTPRSVVIVTNSATLYYDDGDRDRHVTVLEDTPILHRNDDDDDDDKDDDEKNDPPKVGKPDLVVTKTDNGTMISPGALVEYFITIENKGTAPAEGVKVYETVPVGSEFVASSNQGWVLEDGKYVYNLGLLNVGDKREVKYVLKANNPFPTDIVKILNEVEVKDNGTETATTDNKASDDTPILTAVPVIAEPPVVTPPAPELPIPDVVVTPPAPQIPDLPFTGGTAEVELVFTGMGILLMAGGMALKKRR